ncbi:winged helix-turn-helix transcriptional regulator [Pseudaminobacter sp. NGMCC 1.201702]|uniref:winged helix-turn-helix transcriptional regulator n=1 Tax=Pseudaminobacter sp. NGMCC 1.201702 TaxID=3391825 RepID=UPI0039EF5FE2
MQGGTVPVTTNIFVPESGPEASDCKALASILSRIGDKWTVMVVGALSDGPRRYNELRRIIDGISQRMLTLTLKGLERDGLVSRTVYPTVPTRVDYELTELGRTLIAPLKPLFDWARQNREAIEAARARFAEQ